VSLKENHAEESTKPNNNSKLVHELGGTVNNAYNVLDKYMPRYVLGAMKARAGYYE